MLPIRRITLTVFPLGEPLSPNSIHEQHNKQDQGNICNTVLTLCSHIPFKNNFSLLKYVTTLSKILLVP